MPTTRTSILDFRASDVAEQLALLEFQIFKKISLSELSGALWRKKKGDDSKDNPSPHIARMIQTSNKVTE